MTVAAVGNAGRVTFLNSMSDYRAAGNVSISLSSSAMKVLLERSGSSDPQALIGRTVVVAGRIERRPVVNVGASRQVLGFNRWSYAVRVSRPSQLVSLTAG